MIDFTLIIPTHNRASSLKRAIESGLALEYPVDRFDIIVVDNASTDGTEDVVRQFQECGSQKRLRYVRENRLGLHFARHKGAQSATGDVLIFTDDDATFSPTWLHAYGKAFIEHPEMVAAGGPVRPVGESPRPKWLAEFMGESRAFVILSLMEPQDEFKISTKGGFFGVNMAIRRNVLFDVGGFNPESFGDVWLGDGETGLNRKLSERGWLIGYVPNALVYHYIPQFRMTAKYFRRRMANEGACDIYSRYHKHVPGMRVLCKHAVKICVRNAKYWLVAAVLHGRTSNYALNTQILAARSMSQVKYILRLMRSREFRALVTRTNWF